MSRTGATYTCSACRTAVDIPEDIALTFFNGGGAAAIRAEQRRHLATCEPYLAALGARVVAGAEAELRKTAAAVGFWKKLQERFRQALEGEGS